MSHEFYLDDPDALVETVDLAGDETSCALSKAIAPPSLPDLSGGLLSYEGQVRSIPFLSAEKELELAKLWSENEDLNAAWTMAYHHLRLVVATARMFSGYGVNQEDLIQEGNIGLLKAVKKFDYSKGARLSSWALHWIRAEMQNFVMNNWRITKLGSTKPRRKIFFNLRRLRKSTSFLGEEEAQFIANELGVPVNDVRDMSMKMLPDIALDAPLGNEDSSMTLLDTLEGASTEKSFYEEIEDKGILLDAINDLDHRSKDIVTQRWLNAEHAATLQELGIKYNISLERVRQIEVKAMKQLKEKINEVVYGV